MSSARDFKGDYAPGGLTTRSKWRAIGRRGGLASGRKRRQLARGRRPARRRTRDEALSLVYRTRQLSYRQFEARYFEAWPNGNQGGLSTLWEHYVAMFVRYRREGQHYRTTNAQRAAALERRGRPRCERTVRRLNRRLEAMGVAAVSHYRDQRATPGHKDCLVVELRTAPTKNVRPPVGRENPLSGGGSLSAPQDENRPPEPALSPPPAAADDEGAHSGAPVSSEEEELEAAIRFYELKLAAGWASPRLRADLRGLRVRARVARESARARGGDSDRGCSAR